MSGPRRRRFGTVRRLPSGRWQARFRTPDGRRQLAAATFATRAAADRYLATVDLELARGGQVDPRAGAEHLSDYATRWLGQRPRPLRPRALELYEMPLRRHIGPTFGPVAMNAISPMAVRALHAELRARGIGDVTIAKAYRLLRSILMTAVEDEVIGRNPCRLRAAGLEHSAQRRPPTLEEVNKIAAAIEPGYWLLVLLAAWSGLRWGELIVLSRQRVDPGRGSLTVDVQFVEGPGKRLLRIAQVEAGRRTVAIRPHLLPDLREHLHEFVERSRTALLFLGPRGEPLHRSNFHVVWARAQRRAGSGGVLVGGR